MIKILSFKNTWPITDKNKKKNPTNIFDKRWLLSLADLKILLVIKKNSMLRHKSMIKQIGLIRIRDIFEKPKRSKIANMYLLSAKSEKIVDNKRLMLIIR